MSSLSACYFCGTALDASLAEYPVVPASLQPSADEQRTVVLCPTCRRKLGAVVETILETVEESSLDDAVQADLSDAADDLSTIDGSANADDATEAQPADWDEMVAESEAAEREADGADEDDEGVATAEGAGSASSEADDAGSDAAAEQADTAEGATSDDETRLTALEYNRVMRLLQNREFPIDREEFKIVATNAYEIGPDEYDAVIDAAIDRGLIGEEDGQLVEA